MKESFVVLCVQNNAIDSELFNNSLNKPGFVFFPGKNDMQIVFSIDEATHFKDRETAELMLKRIWSKNVELFTGRKITYRYSIQHYYYSK